MRAGAEVLGPVRDIATTRILRLAVGTSLALIFSQAVNWSASFIVPILASVILGLPFPAPSIVAALKFVLVLVGSVLIGFLLLPILLNQPAAGVLLVFLTLFGCFYYGAGGGSPALTTFMLIGITIIPAIGSESIDAALAITQGLAVCAIVTFPFVWLSFAIFPDPPTVLRRAPPAPPPPPSRAFALRSAWRSTVIVFPVMVWILVTSETASYAVVLIKVASMGQQVSLEDTREAAGDLLASTFFGGIAAIVIWNVLQIWPNLAIYGLLFLLCGLIMGPKIFSGAAFAPRAPMWSYAFLTMMVIVAPAVMDSAGGDAAGSRFSDRIVMFLLATFYAVAAVFVFDTLWPNSLKEQE